MPAIEIHDVVKAFSDVKRQRTLVAVDHVSMTIEENDFVCLLGPSGCGKSTLLNMIAGFETPSSGRIVVRGQEVTRPGAERGMVFQQPTLMPWLNVVDNVAFFLALKGLSKSRRRQEAQRYIDMVGLTGFENHYPAELSGGMASRVGVARALLLNPAVILMDEPFAALDAQTRLDIQEELVGIWREHKGTIVFVTHSIDEALVLGTKIAVMSARPGRLSEVIGLDMPYPRDVTGGEFNRHKRHIMDFFRAEAARGRHKAA